MRHVEAPETEFVDPGASATPPGRGIRYDWSRRRLSAVLYGHRRRSGTAERPVFCPCPPRARPRGAGTRTVPVNDQVSAAP
ncbi:hypothetical protein ACIRO1_34895 [Streptomyces sp. NPDC102381]|uniref:hypothetical protein n=1 Tax=Streptomyces sp. NPDC102381 TaxID=3366164 RepID=UPI0037F13F9F